MDVRSANRTDVPAIQEVAIRSWGMDYPDVLSRETIEEGVGEWYSKDRMESQLADEDLLLLVVEDEGEVIAFSHAAWEADAGDVLRLYVRPDRRSKGVGRQLLDRTSERLFERDIDRIKTMVLAANDPGNDFYRSLGFQQAGTALTEIGGEPYEENVYVRDRDQ